jgi:cell division protein FtsQ
MQVKKYIKPTLLLLTVATLLVGMFFIFQKYTVKQRCIAIDIEIVSNKEGRFLTKRNIENLLTDQGATVIKDVAFSAISLENLEKKVLANRLVEQCQISIAHNGKLLVKVIEKVPIARIIAQEGSSRKFKGFYLAKNGSFFPLSPEYSDRVLLLSGEYLIGKKNLKAKADQDLLEFLNAINNSDYHKANFSHCMVDRFKNLSFVHNMGDFVLEYGEPSVSKLEKRMEKLSVFMTQVQQEKLNKYTVISVKYNGQIVCAPVDTTFKNKKTVQSDTLTVL